MSPTLRSSHEGAGQHTANQGKALCLSSSDMSGDHDKASRKCNKGVTCKGTKPPSRHQAPASQTGQGMKSTPQPQLLAVLVTCSGDSSSTKPLHIHHPAKSCRTWFGTDPRTPTIPAVYSIGTEVNHTRCRMDKWATASTSCTDAAAPPAQHNIRHDLHKV